jgi:hypothetical protein
MRYDERAVHGLLKELRMKLGEQEEERILADPKVKALQTKYAALRERQKKLDAEFAPIKKAAQALGIRASNEDGFYVTKASYSDSMPTAAAKGARVKRFAVLERKLRTAMVGGDRQEVRGALDALIAHVDAES